MVDNAVDAFDAFTVVFGPAGLVAALPASSSVDAGERSIALVAEATGAALRSLSIPRASQ